MAAIGFREWLFYDPDRDGSGTLLELLPGVSAPIIPGGGGTPRQVTPGVTFPDASLTGLLPNTSLKGPFGPGQTFRDDNGVAWTIPTNGVLAPTGPFQATGYDLRCAINWKTGASQAFLKNSRVHPPQSWTDGLAGLSQVMYAPNSQQSNLLLEDVEIFAEVPSDWTDGLKGAGWTSRRLDIHDVTDTMLVSGDNTLDEASYLHGNKHWAVDRTKAGGPSHDDGIQVEGGKNNVFRGTRVPGAFNSGMQVTQNAALVDGLWLDRIWIGGGQYTVNVSEKGKGPIKNLWITGVRFTGDSALSTDAGVPATTRADPTFRWESNVNLKTGGAAILKNA